MPLLWVNTTTASFLLKQTLQKMEKSLSRSQVAHEVCSRQTIRKTHSLVLQSAFYSFPWSSASRYVKVIYKCSVQVSMATELVLVDDSSRMLTLGCETLSMYSLLLLCHFFINLYCVLSCKSQNRESV